VLVSHNNELRPFKDCADSAGIIDIKNSELILILKKKGKPLK
jgi:hypothetical protein